LIGITCDHFWIPIGTAAIWCQVGLSGEKQLEYIKTLFPTWLCNFTHSAQHRYKGSLRPP